MTLKDLWIATENRDKIKEFHSLLSDLPFRLQFLDSCPYKHQSPKEIGVTFAENAKIKLDYYKQIFLNQQWVLVEDSGFEVECLGGRPGVHSARYHKGKSLKERLNFLLEEVKQTKSLNRNVQMTSVIICFKPSATSSGTLIEATGVIKGTLAEEMRGEYGFVYDHVFIPKGETRTIAEMGEAYKSKHSHRYQAAQKIKKQLQEFI